MTWEEMKEQKREKERTYRKGRDALRALRHAAFNGDGGAQRAWVTMLAKRRDTRVTVAGRAYDVDAKGTYRRVD